MAVVQQAWAGHKLTSSEQRVINRWLSNHPKFRLATDDDCRCPDDIKLIRLGSGGVWKSVPDYHPYVATGDFNGDGYRDFAVMVIDSAAPDKYTLLVFNGPIRPNTSTASFVETNLKGDALFYGPPRPKPYRLVIGPFESDNTVILNPKGRTYKVEGNEGE